MSDAAAFLVAVTAGFGMLLVFIPSASMHVVFARPAGRVRRIAHRSSSAGALAVAAVCGGLATGLFGVGVVTLAATLIGGFSGARMVRRVAQNRRRIADDLWPQLLETVRVDLALTPRPLADALFAAVRRLPPVVQDRFVSAERVWVNTVDFPRALAVIARVFDDATTDVVCESLRTVAPLPARQANRRLSDIAEDVRTRARHAKDAHATLAGARFARRFVVIVPVVMALVGSFVGDGRAAYQTPVGQVVGTIALVVMVGCWWWAGRLLRVPDAPRVFTYAAETHP